MLRDQSYPAIFLSRQKVTLLRKASKFGIRSANDRFGTKESVYIRKEFNSHRIGTGLAWNISMAALSLFWDTNMDPVTSCENAFIIDHEN